MDEAERLTGRGSWEWDVLTNKAVWSQGMYLLFGVDSATFVNSNENFLALVHPDDRAGLGRAMAAALASPGHFWQEYRLIRPDGTMRFLRGEGNVLPDADGRPRLLYGFVHDITRQREAEEKLRESEQRFSTLFHESVLPVAITRRSDGRIVEVNAAFTRALGFSREEALSKTSADIGVIASDPAADAKAQAELDRTGKLLAWETRIRTRSGQTLDMVASVTKLRFGGEDCLAGSLFDITARKKAEEELARLNEFKSHFMSMVAHDLNNVLTPMRLNLKLVSMEEEQMGGQTVHLAPLRSGIDRMEAFLADLLDVIRLQSGRMAVHKDLFDLADRLRGLVAGQRAMAEAKQVTIGLEVPAMVSFRGDAHRVEQVMSNLLSNAIKFTPPGGSVMVSLKQTKSEARIAVRDTGRGIAEQDMAKLFQPFSQVGVKAQGKHTGTGLGLFISRGIVEQHGGQVWCSSEGTGKGSVFEVRLPLDAAP